MIRKKAKGSRKHLGSSRASPGAAELSVPTPVSRAAVLSYDPVFMIGEGYLEARGSWREETRWWSSGHRRPDLHGRTNTRGITTTEEAQK